MSADRRCFDCRHCGMDMDMDPYCAHPKVLKHNPYGSNVNVVRGAKLSDERVKLPQYNLCGQTARLFAPRAP